MLIKVSVIVLMLGASYLGFSLNRHQPVSLQSHKSEPSSEAEAMSVFDEYVDHIAWTRYWLKNENVEPYSEGQKVERLLFVSKVKTRPKAGFCLLTPSICVTASSSPNQPGPIIKKLEATENLTTLFASFAASNYGDGEMITVPLSPPNFVMSSGEITLPKIAAAPDAIRNQIQPKEAKQQAVAIQKHFSCWRDGKPKAPMCKGTLTYAYYDEADPYWFVARSCSDACKAEFRGDSIMFLRRGENRDWRVTSGGFMNSPANEVARFMQKIRAAKMLEVQLH